MSLWFAASAVSVQLGERWSLNPSQSGWLTTIVQLGFVAGTAFSAMLNLADVIPSRRLFAGSAFAGAIVNAAILISPSYALALVLRFFTGFCLAGVYPPALKSMATWFRLGRGTGLGILVGALTLGSAAPHLINGLGGVDWRMVVVTTSALTVLGGVLAEVAGSEGPWPFPRARFDPRQARLAFSGRGVRLASLGYFGHMWELYAMWAWFVAFYAAVLAAHGDPLPERGAAFATFGVIGAGGFGCWAGGVLGDRWGRTRTTILSMAISGVCALTIGSLIDTRPAVVLAVGLVWGFWVVADSAQFSTIVTEVADQRYVGTAVTLQLAIGFLLTVATIWLIPAVVERVGWRWAFAALVPGPALGSIAMFRLKRSAEAARIAGGRG